MINAEKNVSVQELEFYTLTSIPGAIFIERTNTKLHTIELLWKRGRVIGYRPPAQDNYKNVYIINNFCLTKRYGKLSMILSYALSENISSNKICCPDWASSASHTLATQSLYDTNTC